MDLGVTRREALAFSQNGKLRHWKDFSGTWGNQSTVPRRRTQFIAQITPVKLSIDSETQFDEKSFTTTGQYHFGGEEHLVRFVFTNNDMGGYNIRLEVESDSQNALAISGEISREFTVLEQSMRAYLRGVYDTSAPLSHVALGVNTEFGFNYRGFLIDADAGINARLTPGHSQFSDQWEAFLYPGGRKDRGFRLFGRGSLIDGNATGGVEFNY